MDIMAEAMKTQRHMLSEVGKEKDSKKKQKTKKESVSDWPLLVCESLKLQKDSNQMPSWPFFCWTSQY